MIKTKKNELFSIPKVVCLTNLFILKLLKTCITGLLKSAPWFVAMDVAEILGYGDPKKAVRVHYKYLKLLKGDISAPLTDSPYGINFIPESDGESWFVDRDVLQRIPENYESIKADIDGVVNTYPIRDALGIYKKGHFNAPPSNCRWSSKYHYRQETRMKRPIYT